MTRAGEHGPRWLTDAEFGRGIVARAVTRARIDAALTALTTKRIGLGPFSAGPAGLARVAAEGRLGPALVSEQADGQPTFTVTLPAALDFSVRLGAETKLRADVQVDLVLTPRPAGPLLLVIDVAPVRTRDVRLTVQGTGITSAVTSLLSAITDEIRRQVARQVSAVLDSGAVRAARTIDVAARIDGRPDAPPAAAWSWLDDAEFGRRFLHHAVTRERIANGFAGLAGQPISIGPLRTGPGNRATVRAGGQVGTPQVSECEGGFGALVPMHLDLVVDLARASRYDVEVEVPLAVTPRPAAPLLIVVDIAPVTADTVAATVTAHGALAGLLGRVGHLEEQLCRQVADNVTARLADASGRTVDLGARIDRA